jgi:hypothetical protein
MEEIDLKHELEDEAPEGANPLGNPALDPKHQFNDDGMRYETKHHLLLWLVVFVVCAGAIGYFLTSTDTGKQLLATAGNNAFFNSSATSSFSLSSSLSSDEPTAITISPRDFANLTAEQVAAQMQSDLETASILSNPDKLFDDLDSEAELGVGAKNSSSTTSATSSKSN